jgi:hypothetical protein
MPAEWRLSFGAGNANIDQHREKPKDDITDYRINLMLQCDILFCPD